MGRHGITEIVRETVAAYHAARDAQEAAVLEKFNNRFGACASEWWTNEEMVSFVLDAAKSL